MDVVHAGKGFLHTASIWYCYLPSGNKIINVLVDISANVNLQVCHSRTILHILGGHNVVHLKYEIVDFLMNMGADVFNLKDNLGKTPCQYFSNELKEYLGINENTKTIKILKGSYTKCAKKWSQYNLHRFC